MTVLIKHNTFVNYDKYKTHKEDSIGWFNYINPTVVLQSYKKTFTRSTNCCIYDRGENKSIN